MRRAALVALAVLSLGAGGEELTEQARRYFEAGKQAYQAAQYMAAATAFQEALRVSPKPQIMFSAAQAYRLQYFVDRDMKKLRKAIQLYRKYIDEVKSGGRREDAVGLLAQLEPMLRGSAGDPDRVEMEATPTQLMVSSRTPGAHASLDDGAHTEVPLIAQVDAGKHHVYVEAEGHFPETVDSVAVEGRLVVVEVNLKPRPARLDIDAPSGATISIDGRLVGTAPLVAPLAVPAGKHYLVVTGRGRYPHTAELAAERGQTQKLAIELESTVQRQIAWGFLAGAGALLAGGGVAAGFAIAAESDANALDTKLAGGENLQPDEIERYNGDLDRRDTLRVVSGAVLGAAVLAGATGLLLYLIDQPRVEERKSLGDEPILTPTTTGDGLGLQLQLSF